MTTLTAPARPFPSFLSLARTRAVVDLKTFLRDKDQLIWVMAFPLGMYALFATIFGGNEYGPDGSYVSMATIMLPGMLAYGVFISGFQNLATAIAYEREKGNLKRLRATPLPPTAFFAGKIAQVLTISLVQAALLLTLASLAFGADLPATASAWLTFGWAYLLGIGSGTVLGIAFSSLPKTAKAAGNMSSGIATVLAFASGVFIVTSNFPVWLTRIAEIFPLYWGAAAMRSAFLPEWVYSALSSTDDGQPRLLLGAAVLSAWLVVGLAASVKTFRWTQR